MNIDQKRVIVNSTDFILTPIDSSNDQNICVELFKVTFTH